jgi:hypothetical protein
VNSANSRLKELLTYLFKLNNINYDKLSLDTGHSKSTWQRAVKDGGHIKVDLLTSLRATYGFEISYVTDPRADSIELHLQSVHTSEHLVNEKLEKYKALKANAPKGSMASKLKLKDYENPVVVLSFATIDMRNEWEERLTMGFSKEENDAWLHYSLTIIRDIATRHLQILDEKQQDSDNTGE